MKKTNPLFTAAALAAVLLSACAAPSSSTINEETASETPAAESETIKIVTTIFPEYEWVIHILGDQAENAEVTMLLESGVDLHSYQPSASDMVKIAESDLFIYVDWRMLPWKR